MAEAYKWLSLPIGFAVWFAAAWWAGSRVDDWAGTYPWGQVVGGLVGWALGFVYVYYAAKVAVQGERRRDGRRPD